MQEEKKNAYRVLMGMSEEKRHCLEDLGIHSSVTLR
jgi:hypothetical protein